MDWIQLDADGEERETRKSARVALQHLINLRDLLNEYLEAQKENPEWEGPRPYSQSEWLLDLNCGNEDTLVLQWPFWDEDRGNILRHCHIRAEDLFQDPSEAIAQAKARHAEKERKAREAREKALVNQQTNQQAQEKAELARLLSKYGVPK